MTTGTATRVRLGMTDLEVSPIAFGTWSFGGEWGLSDEGEGRGCARRGSWDELLRYRAGLRLRGRRGCSAGAPRPARAPAGEMVIATKGGLRRREDGWCATRAGDGCAGGSRRASGRSASSTSTSIRCTGPTRRCRSRRPRGRFRSSCTKARSGTSASGAPTLGRWPNSRSRGRWRHFSRHMTLPARHRARDPPVLPKHDVGVLIYGPLSHGLLTGAMDENTTFAPDDWRSGAPFFKGESFVRTSRWSASSSGSPRSGSTSR